MPKPPRKGKAKGQRQDEGQEQNLRANRTSRSSKESHFENKKTFVTPSNVAENVPLDEDQDTDSKYHRRNIQSNWDRFKEIEDERIVQRGEDFQHLLQNSGGLNSHFQFKEEKEWDEDDEDDPFMSTSFDFLRIDCSALRENLDAIPLHKRLGISEDVFTPEEIRHFQQVADDKRSRLKSNSNAASERKEGLICDSHHVAPSPNDRIRNQLNAGEFDLSIPTSSVTDPAKSLPADLEDELDRILSLSNNMIDQSGHGTSSNLEHFGHHSSLEDLLNIDLH